MTINGNRASVFNDKNKTWSKFMPIAEAEKYEHNLRVQRFLTSLRAGKQIIGLRNEISAMMDAQDIYKAEREGASNTLSQAE